MVPSAIMHAMMTGLIDVFRTNDPASQANPMGLHINMVGKVHRQNLRTKTPKQKEDIIQVIRSKVEHVTGRFIGIPEKSALCIAGIREVSNGYVIHFANETVFNLARESPELLNITIEGDEHAVRVFPLQAEPDFNMRLPDLMLSNGAPLTASQVTEVASHLGGPKARLIQVN